jgi:hypothetical protein
VNHNSSQVTPVKRAPPNMLVLFSPLSPPALTLPWPHYVLFPPLIVRSNDVKWPIRRDM